MFWVGRRNRPPSYGFKAAAQLSTTVIGATAVDRVFMRKRWPSGVTSVGCVVQTVTADSGHPKEQTLPARLACHPFSLPCSSVQP